MGMVKARRCSGWAIILRVSIHTCPPVTGILYKFKHYFDCTVVFPKMHDNKPAFLCGIVRPCLKSKHLRGDPNR